MHAARTINAKTNILETSEPLVSESLSLKTHSTGIIVNSSQTITNQSNLTTNTSNSLNFAKYKKYAKSFPITWNDPTHHIKPSDLIRPTLDIIADEYPQIIENINLSDHSFRVNSSVSVDEPLFQPSPKILLFDDYNSYSIHEKKIYFRNNDIVARCFKIRKPDSNVFSISSLKHPNGESLRENKIASGMEIYVVIQFKAKEIMEYSYDLICETEREAFIVPIRAIGSKTIVSFPDEIDFGSQTIKASSRKSIFIQNMGSIVAKFQISSLNPNVFSCNGEEITLQPNQNRLIDFYFTPLTSSLCKSEFEVTFSTGLKCYINVSGKGNSINVALNQSEVVFPICYITKLLKKTISIVNSSDNPVNFSWKSYANEVNDEHERQRLLIEIQRMEANEIQLLESHFHDVIQNIDPNINSESINLQYQADKANLIRKYKNLVIALKNDKMQFVDKIFEIIPAEGCVSAHSELEVTIVFTPDVAAHYDCLAYLDIFGRQERLLLHLLGQGMGPKVTLSYDILDVGDVFINDEQQYELKIINNGDIEANWSFLSSLTSFGMNKFEFSPNEGLLPPRESQTISIKFESNVLGEFSEFFRFAVKGNDNLLICNIKGQVIGPTYHFDCHEIDFGIVSYDFLHSHSVRLVNTSTIPIPFQLYVPQDNDYLKREFNVEPNEGILLPGQHTDILIEFIPAYVKVYAYSLAMDILGVGKMLSSLPIHAECVISSASFHSKEVNFGDCFIRYPYESILTLTNNSDKVHASFEFLDQSIPSKAYGSYEIEPKIATITPGGTMDVLIRLVPVKLGKSKIAASFMIAGSDSEPIEVLLVFNCIGPKILSSDTDIRFGNIECLKDYTLPFTLTNDSLISASIKLFLKLAKSKYSLDVYELVLAPHESYELKVNANLDDSLICKDELHIIVEEGDHIMTPISSKGIGTTISSKYDLRMIDFGCQLSTVLFSKSIVLENKGSRSQYLQWTNKSIVEENQRRTNELRKLGGKESMPLGRIPKHLQPIEANFTVVPNEITLRPRTTTTFQFSGSIKSPGVYQEIFLLESRIGKEKRIKTIVETIVKCEIMHPLLGFSIDKVSFNYTWERDVPPRILQESITLTNQIQVPLIFRLDLDFPFILSEATRLEKYTLEPQESINIIVQFDPTYRRDQTTHSIQNKMKIIYENHSQRDIIALDAEVNYPNLQFDRNDISFGCILNDTSKIIRMKVTNWTNVDATFHWNLIDETSSSMATISTNESMSKSQRPLHEVLDILPVRSHLASKESEIIEFRIFCQSYANISAKAICLVEGGPQYIFNISGESSDVSYSIDRTFINFDKVVYNDRKDEILHIINNGLVPFPFSIHTESKSAEEVLQFIPNTGTVEKVQSFKVTVRIYPGLPRDVDDFFIIRIGHFEPMKIKFSCQSILCMPIISLPRSMDLSPYGERLDNNELLLSWEEFHDESLANIDKMMSKINAEALNTSETFASSTLQLPVFSNNEITEILVDNDEATTIASQMIIMKPKSSKRDLMLRLELEKLRMTLLKLLTNRIDQVREFPLASPMKPVGSLLLSPTKSIASDSMFTMNTKPNSLLQRLISKRIPIESIVAGNYIIDFGNVIYGKISKKYFHVTNGSEMQQQLTWLFDKKVLQKNGFTIDPLRVSKLRDKESLEFTASYFGNPDHSPGLKEVILPFMIPKYPTLHIQFKAFLCYPEIKLSSDSLDFDSLLIGRCKTSHVVLQNVSPVNVTWKCKHVSKAMEKIFLLSATEGIIRPGKKVIISIEFIPIVAREYTSDIVFRIDSNPKQVPLHVSGTGIEATLQFSQQELYFNPIKPYSNGDEKIITIHNASDFDVEIFSVDFDSIYLIEELELSQVTEYDSEGIFRTSLRLPGNGLPPEVKASLEKARNVEDTYANDVYPILRTESESEPRDSNIEQDILLMSLSSNESTKIATKLQEKLLYPIVTIDSMIEDVMKCNNEIGLRLKRMLSRLSPDELEGISQKEQILIEAAEASKLAATEAYKKQVKKKVKDIPQDVLNTVEVEELRMFQESGLLSIEGLFNILNYRLQWKDLGYGVILNGIDSTFITKEMVLNILPRLFPRLVVLALSVNQGFEGYCKRRAFLVKLERDLQEKLLIDVNSCKKSLNNLRSKSRHPKSLPYDIGEDVEFSNNDPSIAVAIPEGHESWVSDSGVVTELDSSDYRSLDEVDKVKYLSQLLYYKDKMLHRIQNYLQTLDLSDENNDSSDQLERENEIYVDYESHTIPALKAFSSTINNEDESDILVDVRDSRYLEVTFDANETIDEVMAQIAHILPSPTFQRPNEEKLESFVQQVLRRPILRPLRKPNNVFTLSSIDSSTDADSDSKSFRWSISSHSDIQFKVVFKSTVEGSFDSNLLFEVVGTNQVYSLYCNGLCDVPKINDDVRNIFMRRIRNIPASGIWPDRKLITNENFYSFGPLAIFKSSLASWRDKQSSNEEDNSKTIAIQGNCDSILISNNGKFKTEVTLAWEDNSIDSKDVFIAEPSSFTLEENETQQVKIWAFPSQPKQYYNKLIVILADNPLPYIFPVTCIGQNPTMQAIGPWDEIIEQAKVQLVEYKGKDKKVLKDLESKVAQLQDSYPIDFGRVLLDKVEVKSFHLSNTCQLPIAWEIVFDDDVNSNCINVSPMSGIIQPQRDINIEVFFSSSESLVMNKKFHIHYSDTEGGLLSNRIEKINFLIMAESYFIKAISLLQLTQKSDESISKSKSKAGNQSEMISSTSLDFGVMRVSDYAKLEMRLQNEGKYRIGFRFQLKSKMQKLLQIKPMEGFIEAQEKDKSVDISFIFCCSDGEMIFRDNKDVMVSIFEPETSEVVEVFALSISAVTKYNQVRLQPSKGLQFGALRFGVGTKSKDIELKNEGLFPITYCICKKRDDGEELNNLDINSFSSYLFGVPAGLRSLEAGEGYLNKILTTSSVNKSKAKGKTESGQLLQNNSLVFDPDSLVSAGVLSDPLLVNAFQIHPRIGVLEPGQRVTIDIQFNPKEFRPFKEILRFFISGLDSKDPLSSFMKSFELSGENAYPMIDNDSLKVFEESEIVHSIKDCFSVSNTKSARFENLPFGRIVFCEEENSLYFGPSLCNPSLASTNGNQMIGLVQRVCIVNSSKVDAKVNMKIIDGLDISTTSKSKDKGSKSNTQVNNLAFSCFPSSFEIPPHERKYVSIQFNPTEIKTYRAKFVAEIENSIQLNEVLQNQSLSFDIGGSGTLPTVTIDSLTKASNGTFILDFDRIHVHQSIPRVFTLSNPGCIPATCLVYLNGSSNFNVPSHNSSILIPPGEMKEITVIFNPKVAEKDTSLAEIKVSVLQNPFDGYTIQLKGVAYESLAIIEPVSDDEAMFISNDRIQFNDLNLDVISHNNSSERRFRIRSRCKSNLTFNLKLEGNSGLASDIISFIPSYGHLLANDFVDIVATFTSDKPIQLNHPNPNPVILRCDFQTINYSIDYLEKWDNSMQILRKATEEDMAAIATATELLNSYNSKLEALVKAKNKKAITELGPPPQALNITLDAIDENGNQLVRQVIAEPPFEVISMKVFSDWSSSLSIKCFAVADNLKYQCNLNGETIQFHPTYMLQTKSHKLSFVNESNIRQNLKFSFERLHHGFYSCPFTISPEERSIPANSTCDFIITFAPLEIEDYSYALIGQFDGVDDTEQVKNIKIIVNGTAKRPICHFDVEDNKDYLSSRRNDLPNEKGVMSLIETSNLRCVKVISIGINVRNTISFFVTNPTGEDYDFLWNSQGLSSSSWRCIQSSGRLGSGNRVEMIFEFIPTEMSIGEAFFEFKIPSLKLSQLFLFAGIVQEPNVFFELNHIDFRSVMLGGEGATETIVLENKEDKPFNFSFDKNMLSQLEGIAISPVSGIVMGHSKVGISITFHPKEEILYNYNILCSIRNKAQALSMNIKGEGYAVHPLLQVSDEVGLSNTSFQVLLPSPSMNYIDFGMVQVFDNVTRNLTLSNQGKYNFEYLWDIDDLSNCFSLKGNKLNGTLHKSEELTYTLGFKPMSESSIDNINLYLKVAGSKVVYNIIVKALAVSPALKFSFTSHDFGSCYISSIGGSTLIEEVKLKLTNHDPVNNISIDCNFQKTRSLWLEMNPLVIEPGNSIDIPIYFAPRDLKDYIFVIPFLINGTTKIPMNIFGKGIQSRVELVNPSLKQVNFGIINVHSQSRKIIEVINRGKKAIPIQLIDSSSQGLKNVFISFHPSHEIILRPNEVISIDIIFQPEKRLLKFQEDLSIRYGGLTRKLCHLSGSAKGIDAILDSDSLPFGSVVIGSKLIKKLQLENIGDVTIHYQWLQQSFGRHFMISPLNGKLIPGSSLSFDVIFEPQEIHEDIRQENMFLTINGMSPLVLTCSGICISQPKESIQLIEFESPVRKVEMKVVKVKNDTDKDWFLTPSLSSEHWKVSNELRVPAKGISDFIITYYPLSMAIKKENDQPHYGQVFLSLPSGNVLLYQLQGYANHPECNGIITIDGLAKVMSFTQLSLKNWLSTSQEFQIIVNIEESPSIATKLILMNVINIPSNGSKDIPIRFLSYCEGITTARITFKNLITKEYVFYNFIGKVHSTEIIETISLESQIRQSMRYILTIDNPLAKEEIVTMGKPITTTTTTKTTKTKDTSTIASNDWWSCDSKFINVKQLTPFNGNIESSFEIEYRPLVITKTNQGVSEAILSIFTKELGVFKYKLSLIAKPSLITPSLRFEVPFGSNQIENFIFQSYNTTKIDYQCQVKRVDVFNVNKSLIVDGSNANVNANANANANASNWEGKEVSLSISFEPTSLGEVSDVLTISSNDGSEYICNLIGNCITPLPQGPFTITQGLGSIDIPFRNVFTQSCLWNYSIDSNAFRLTSTNSNVNAKSDSKVSLFFEPNEDHMKTPSGVISAKLFITSSIQPDIPFIYYIRGIIDMNAKVIPSKSTSKK